MNERLPVGWTTATLGEVVSGFEHGYTAKADHRGRGPRFLRISDLTHGRIDWSAVPSCGIGSNALAKYRLVDGDLVFARTGSIEKACRVRNPPESVFASYLIRGRPVDQALGPWLETFTSSYGYANQAAAASAGIGRANVNAKSLARIELALPPLPEQHRIVDVIESCFTRLDDAVATLSRVQRNLKRFRASVLSAAVEGRLVPTEAALARTESRDYEPASVLLERILTERRHRWEKTGDRGKYQEPVAPDTSELPDTPEGWCWATADQILWKITDGEHLSPTTTDHGVFLLSAKDVREEGVTFDESKFVSRDDADRFRRRCDPEPGDVLVVGRGATIGRTTVVQPCDSFCLMGSVILLKTAPPTDSRYTSLYLRSQAVQRRLVALSVSAAQQAIYIRDLRALPVALPPAAEQARAIESAERLLSVADAVAIQVRAQSRRCARLHQSIFKWAFDGRLVDQDPDDEPASVLMQRIAAERAAAGATKNGRVRRKDPRAA